MIRELREIIPKIIGYRLYRLGLFRPGSPFNLTFSVTHHCQSKCRTCHIWQIYRRHPEKVQTELTLWEIEKIFKSMGHIYIFNISGGEPFLRTDLVEIVDAACKHLSPGIIHIPTNAVSPPLVLKKTSAIIDILKTRYPDTRLTIKPSLDQIGEEHDVIRGVKGNFKKVIQVFDGLKALKPRYKHLDVELGTVISKWNVHDIKAISEFVMKLQPDSYRNEIAEQRSEMFNTSHTIAPNPDDYKKAVGFFVSQTEKHMKNRGSFQKITHAFRRVYYDLAIRILDEQRKVIPCYAGISNAHMTPDGDIWACCTLGYDHPMGNLRDHGYNFHQLWKSRQAESVRQHIKAKNCACPMANQMYANILMAPLPFIRVLMKIIC
ncbi:radical SAM protein [Desulfosarcina sp. OttesenSCG-928-A07]|nr:radical SAM protein [Desulfosarcina sp. OttesenSCG-928-A07]